MLTLTTRAEIENNLGIIVSGVKVTSIKEYPKLGLVVIDITIPWWKWLLPGIIHFIYRRRVEKAFKDFGPVGIGYMVRVS